MLSEKKKNDDEIPKANLSQGQLIICTHLPPIWLSTSAAALIRFANDPAISGTEWPLDRALSRTVLGDRRASLPDGSACGEMCESVASCMRRDGGGLRQSGIIASGL